jgi:hypothetical protein
MKISQENIFNTFSSSVLSPQEMSTVKGGKRRKPKSRDKDIYDDDFDEVSTQGRKKKN